jgi:hypothetical protein
VIGDRAHHRRAQQHQHVGDASGERPQKRGRAVVILTTARDHADEIGIENRREHHRGVAGVGEVEHRPREDFAARGGHTQTRGVFVGHVGERA